MRYTRGRVVDVETLADFDRRLAAGAIALSGWRLRHLDLRGHSATLRRCRLEGATFLGCTFAPGDVDFVQRAGALVLPEVGDAPVEVYRSRLYTAAELYDAEDYPATLDARAYAWSQEPQQEVESAAKAALARTLHDHAIDAALAAWVADRRLVGVMGGHAAERGELVYRDAVRLGRGLGAHATVATGGGPGAMEAANLGARLAGHPWDDVAAGVEELAAVPSFRPSVGDWLHSATALAARFDRADESAGESAGESLGIPTWHYGHEPPNRFATAIAKYFRNAVRESILLQACDAGIVFLPGTGDTVQEIFQDACENYYADETSVAPMVLVGVEYWTETLPAWPLLRTLARGRAMEPHVHLVDTVDDAVALIGRT